MKDRLHDSALALSGGQQQRLCIARALAVQPEILLMDEPASALDPIATQRIEELIYDLKKTYTIVIVTHNMQQAARVSDYTAFFWLGRLVEFDRTDRIFTAPAEKLTEDYVTGQVRLGSRWNACSALPGRARAAQGRGCSTWAGWPRSACAQSVQGLVERDLAAARRRCCAATSRSTSCTSRSTTAASSCWRCTSRWPPTCASIVAAVKINTDLERVGDLAVNIAEAGKRYLQHPPVKQLIDIPRMGEHRAGDAARRARRLRAPRHRAGRRRCSTRTTSSTR